MIYKILIESCDLFGAVPLDLLDKLECNEFGLFLQIPNLTKVDILEYFEFNALHSLDYSDEIDNTLLNFYDFANRYELNSTMCDFADDYIAIIGQLFLAGYIDFYRSMGSQDELDNTPKLSQYNQQDSYEIWVYFRNNYIYENDDLEKLIENLCNKNGDFWANAKNWDYLNINCTRTQKGTKYFNEILSPRFYEKYKDLEVEIDDKGQILAWYKNGVRVKS